MGRTARAGASALAALDAAKDHIPASPELQAQAMRLHQNGDELEIDSDAASSPGEGGTWVQAWVWVPKA